MVLRPVTCTCRVCVNALTGADDGCVAHSLSQNGVEDMAGHRLIFCYIHLAPDAVQSTFRIQSNIGLYFPRVQSVVPTVLDGPCDHWLWVSPLG